MNQEISITVIDRQGKAQQCPCPTDMGLNLMEVFKSYDLPVEGTCGGMALCASCHCYIQSEHRLTEKSDDEENMLDEAFFVQDNSRLSCQVRIDKSCDGLVVQLAPVG